MNFIEIRTDDASLSYALFHLKDRDILPNHLTTLEASWCKLLVGDQCLSWINLIKVRLIYSHFMHRR